MTYFVIISNFDDSISNIDNSMVHLWYYMFYIHRGEDSHFGHHVLGQRHLICGMHHIICNYMMNDKILHIFITSL